MYSAIFSHLKKFLSILTFVILVGCSSDDETPLDCSAVNLQAVVDNVMDASCGTDNGGFEITLSGGAAPYQLTIGGVAPQIVQAGTNTITDLTAGNYNLTVLDGNSCSVTASVNIADINNVILNTQMEASGCQTANGSITIAASGGNEPYMYSLDGGAMQADNVFTGLAVGDYTTLVSDADGCQTSTTVTVLSGVSYNDNIVPLINTHCAIPNCHDGSNGALPNWTNLTTVQANAENIKTRTSDMTMPPAGRPDLEVQEIQAIACWVDDGALNN